MTTYFVTRHQGAVDWAERHGHADAKRLSHLDPEVIRAGDVVIGSLPVSLALEVERRGGRFLCLTLKTPEAERGRELSADDMDRFGAHLEEVSVRPAAPPPPKAVPTQNLAGRRSPWRDQLDLCGRWLLAGLLGMLFWVCADGGKSAIVSLFGALKAAVLDTVEPRTLAVLLLEFVGWSVGLSAVSVAIARLGREFLRPRIRAKSIGATQPRPVLVMTSSLINRPRPGHDSDALYERCLTLPATAILTDTVLSEARYPYQHSVRALYRHLQPGKTTQVYVLTSKQTVDDYDRFAAVLVQAGRSVDATVSVSRVVGCPVDYDNYAEVYDVVHQLLIDLTKGRLGRWSARDISFDATGGTKITGIAAAVVAMNRDLEFSYVPNDYGADNPRVMVFDAEFRSLRIQDAVG